MVLKVSKEIDYAIRNARATYGLNGGRSYDEKILETQQYKLFLNDRAVLNEMSSLDLADALLNGYEVEMTPQEKVSEMYNLPCTTQAGKSYNSGIEFTLSTLNIKIKGVNA